MHNNYISKKGINERSSKGFTLIELLAVIVILAIIAMIAVPTVLSIIEKSRRNAFKDSVYGIMESADLFAVTENYSAKDNLEFTCDGNSCSLPNGKSLQFKGTVPISGSIQINGGDTLANFIKNGEYCALGTKGSLVIDKDCEKLDYTVPVIDATIVRATSKSIIISFSARDAESGISKASVSLGSDKREFNQDTPVGVVSSDGILFDDLDSNKDYTITITATNGNKMDETKTVNVTTKSISNPGFTFTGNPTEAKNGYFKSQTINVDYDDENTPDSATNYIRTARNGVSSVAVTKSCGTVTDTDTPDFDNCTDISSTTNLAANVWYVAPSDLSITYDTAANETAVLEASTYDGKHYSGTATYTVSKIDTTSPDLTIGEILQKTNSLLINYTAEDSESGIQTPVCKYGLSADSLTETGIVTNSSCSITGLDAEKTYFYQVCVADQVGNTSTCKEGSTSTKPITNPVFTSSTNPTSAIEGFVISQTVTVTFGNNDMDDPNYYIRTSKAGTSNINVSATCTNNEELDVPNFDSCTEASTKDLQANTWYKVPGTIDITYNTPTEENGLLEAIAYDGRNYTGTATTTLLKIFYDSADVTYTNEVDNNIQSVKGGLDYVYGNL